MWAITIPVLAAWAGSNGGGASTALAQSSSLSRGMSHIPRPVNPFDAFMAEYGNSLNRAKIEAYVRTHRMVSSIVVPIDVYQIRDGNTFYSIPAKAISVERAGAGYVIIGNGRVVRTLSPAAQIVLKRAGAAITTRLR